MDCVLLLLDDVNIKPEVRYAIGLARRIEVPLIILLLLDLDFDRGEDQIRDAQKRGEKALVPYVRLATEEKITVTAAVKVGSPASELLKFLAEGYSPRSVVWGGDQNILTSKKLKSTDHWMVSIKDKFSCPLVAPMANY